MVIGTSRTGRKHWAAGPDGVSRGPDAAGVGAGGCTAPTSAGRQRILRSVYECVVFQTLRDKLRCKGDLGHRRREAAQPRGRPARGLRGQPGRVLRRAPQAAGRHAVHQRADRGGGHRTVRAQRLARRRRGGLAEDRRAQEKRRGDPAQPAGQSPRFTSPVESREASDSVSGPFASYVPCLAAPSLARGACCHQDRRRSP